MAGDQSPKSDKEIARISQAIEYQGVLMSLIGDKRTFLKYRIDHRERAPRLTEVELMKTDHKQHSIFQPFACFPAMHDADITARRGKASD